MLVDAWLARAAAARGPSIGAADARRAPSPTRSCTPPRGPAPASSTASARRRGDRVGIALPAGLDFARALHACLLLGAAAVPVDLRLSARRAGAASRAVRGVVRRRAAAASAGARAAPAMPATPRHDLDATALVIHTSGTSAAAARRSS